MKKILTIILAVLISIASLPAYAFADDVIETENVSDVYINEENNVAPYFNPVTSTQSGTWIKESNGRWWYKHADGSYTKYDWEYINGSWYFFDKNGWMWTEWLSWEGNWYYLNPSGVMHTGWLLDGGKWYYFTSRGIMVYRWNKINGFWYYFDGSDGSMNKKPFSYAKRKYTFYQSGDHEGALMTTIIDLDRRKQEKGSWCWAASSQMVGTYNTNNNVSQADIVRYVKGKVDDVGGSDSDIKSAIYFASGKSKKCTRISRYDIVFNDLRDRIDDNHPFVIHMSWNGGGGHAVVGAGYDQYNGWVWVIDPWRDTSSRYYDYKSLIKGDYTIATGTGHCSAVIVY